MFRAILFDVEHGFCAFLKTPTGRTILVDCGKAANFSPIKYIREHELGGVQSLNERPLTELVVTHPHEDHIEDIDSVIRDFPPALLRRHKFNWDYIKTGNTGAGCYECLDKYSEWQARYDAPAVEPDFGASVQFFSLTPNEARAISSSNNSTVNNSSLVVVVTVVGTQVPCKFVFGGDMEQAGWTELLKRQNFRNAVAGTCFYFASHHGHKSGFSTELLAAMGTPLLNIVSITSCDESHDDRYSSREFAQGFPVGGEWRRMLTTRTDGAVCIDVNNAGVATVTAKHLPENLLAREFNALAALAGMGLDPNYYRR